MASREQRLRELAELARKRDAYWDRRREEGHRRRAIGLALLLACYVGFLVTYWFMLDEPDRRWNVVIIAVATTLSTVASLWWRRRGDRSSSGEGTP